ncbi:hypothetical protein DNU06_07095 [Putridiphycobacter roseus]|uniref:STAS/SEC14 domain-containing protein n=1 Tax=Putridiphycobacter roseus TaxID=2219161 RepID=A0A2W1NSE0_9FLAO|nr:hypothetical protein [Putridiphycobacter roseus]PZE17588.1 hypothetical protein DNU06_07095 [Putridiphycobacter roseus]
MTTIIKQRTNITDLITNNIVRTEFLDNTISSITDLWDSYQSYLILSEEQPLKKLVVFNENAFLDIKEDHTCEMARVHPSAIAFVTNNLSIRLVLKTYATTFKSKAVKIFKNETEAMFWLQSV